ncbi:hypothetical protein BC792_101300 [Sphingobacterium allocomposti]|uniref:Uncharacterized protein n=1 Tax=Sphingobacterium allocomposti TaxID=415956 RepID=A0A5S5DV43_9SPHI|nr:hypothetical protein BC792_101300 [Sphingobacterium composti Yoo et al. 2007 non Ten et al. 2007]
MRKFVLRLETYNRYAAVNATVVFFSKKTPSEPDAKPQEREPGYTRLPLSIYLTPKHPFRIRNTNFTGVFPPSWRSRGILSGGTGK